MDNYLHFNLKLPNLNNLTTNKVLQMKHLKYTLGIVQKL